jgi:HAD superfamily hydrolase (TIGR01509 family)
MALDAVLWDMDGTLVDTEPDWIASEFDLVAAHGNGRWTEAHGHALVGMDLRDAARYLQAHGGVKLSVPDTIEALLDGVVARVRVRVPWRPGARELLEALREAGIPSALVTMSWRRFVDAILPSLPPGSFSAVVTGDDVRQGKPHPEPYLRGAELLGVHPARTVAIEDSPTGARSAWAAGCTVLAVPNVVAVPSEVCHVERSTLLGLTVDDVVAIQRDIRSPSGDRTPSSAGYR